MDELLAWLLEVSSWTQ